MIEEKRRTLATLTQARAFLDDKEHWWRFTFNSPDGKASCALGAVMRFSSRPAGFGCPWGLNDVIPLNDAAAILYRRPIVQINDLFGYAPTLACFDYAIAKLRKEIMDMDIGKKIKTGETEKPQLVPMEPIKVAPPTKEPVKVG